MIIKPNSLTFKTVLSVLLMTATPHLFSDLSLQAQQACYQDGRDGWKYLEFIFIEQPKHQVEDALAQAQHVMLAVGALVLVKNDIIKYASNYCGYITPPAAKTITVWEEVIVVDDNGKATGAVKQKEAKREVSGINISTKIAQVTLCKVAYEIYSKYIQRSIRKATLANFLQNWKSHQTHIPQELVPAFNELYEQYNADATSLTDSNVEEILEIICHLLEHNFTNRYKSDSKSPDILGSLKTFSDLGKNLNG